MRTTQQTEVLALISGRPRPDFERAVAEAIASLPRGRRQFRQSLLREAATHATRPPWCSVEEWLLRETIVADLLSRRARPAGRARPDADP